MAITLAQLKTQSRQRADQENSNFVEDAELVNYINSSIAELHDILVQAYGSDYFVTTDDFTTTSNDNTYDLPEDFYKLHAVDARVNGSDYVNITKFNFNERNASASSDYFKYRIVGSSIMFAPTPSAGTAIRVWYTPLATKLEEDADELNDFNQYSEYVIVDAAIKMLLKEESDVAELMAIKQGLLQRITYAAENRDAAQPESITDVYSDGENYRGRD